MQLEPLLQQLYARRRFGISPGLERMRALLQQLDAPQQEWLALHIAGTNGKGSVAAMTAAMLQGAGIGPIGRFTSPHLLSFNERITIDGQPVTDEALLPALQKVVAAAAAVAAAGQGEATFFEAVTALAYELFRQAGVRLAVIETGLGGRLDATNTLNSLVTVITSIALDHSAILGETLEAVAREKAGIIKPHRPVVAGAIEESPLGVIATIAQQQNAPLILAAEEVGVVVRYQGFDGIEAEVTTQQRSLGRVRLPLAGSFQAENLAVALAALEVLQTEIGISIDDEHLKRSLAKVVWPGRFQLVQQSPPVLVDGAHNPAAAAKLRRSLHQMRAPREVALVAGFCDDKDVAHIVPHLAGFARIAWAVPTPSSRSMAPQQAAMLLRQSGVATEAESSLSVALAAAEEWAAAHDGMVVICGSLFLVGAALQHYQAYPWNFSGVADPNEQLQATPCNRGV